MRKVSFKQELIDKNIELSVIHLKEYYKVGGHGRSAFTTKAVDDVTFDIKKGECFGVVGESGCGKTSTGRSILRLYDITSGSIYFEGTRISAGKGWNEEEIKSTQTKGKNEIKKLQKEMKEELYYAQISPSYANEIKELKNIRARTVKELKSYGIEYKNCLSSLKKRKDSNNIKESKTAAKVEYIDKSKDAKSRIIAIDEQIKCLTAEAFVDARNRSNDIAKLKKETSSKYTKKIKEIRDHIKAVKVEQTEAIKQINYDNKHVNKKLMSKMQMIFQDPVDSLDPRMTVEDIIQEGLRIQGQRNKFANSKKVGEVLKKVGLIPEFASRYPHEFSGGQRQRIGIARALVMNPSFLICDEPISALDVSIRAQIINLLNELKEEMGLTIMFIAHDLSVVKYFCDRIAVMYFGKIVELATSEELFKHPLHPYSKALLSAIPKPDPISEKSRQRIVYNPKKEHDYSKEEPTMQEIVPGHFILANSKEMAKYRDEIIRIDSAKK